MICLVHIWKISVNILGKFQEISGNSPGNVLEMFRTPQDISHQFPVNSRKFRQTSRPRPGAIQEFSRRFHGKYMDNSGHCGTKTEKLLRHFREISVRMLGTFQHISKTIRSKLTSLQNEPKQQKLKTQESCRRRRKS